MLITKERAAEIASDFMRSCNPDHWDGKGVIPKNFVGYGKHVYKLDDTGDVLQIWFKPDPVSKTWYYRCSLCMGDNMGLSMVSSGGTEIHDADRIADTILALFQVDRN
ncbi:MAG: hypothetical protein LUE86_01490 [Clostridiales bacterium]|nr:hypothetical protein [Clostridiales bacterium]